MTDKQQSDQLALWIHYEELAADDKNKMIATASWLLGLALGGLAMCVGELFPGKEGRASVACVLSLASIVLGLVSVYLIVAFARHAARRYEAADKIRTEQFSNENVFNNENGWLAGFVARIDSFTERGPRLFKENVGRVFDNLLRLSIAIIILGCTTFLVSLVMLVA